MGEQLDALQALATRLWSRTAWWHPGGLAWSMCSARDADQFAPRVWRDRGRVVAWSLEEGPGHLTALIDPDYGDLADEVVRGRGSLHSALVVDSDVALIAALRAAGFTETDELPFGLDMRRPAAGIAEVPIAAGYTVRGANPGETAALVALHRAAWNPGELPWKEDARPHVDPTAESTFTIEAMRRVEAAPLYRHDLHVVAENYDGALAASCIAWLDPVTGAAEIEPVGTHPAHRGHGLAASVCLEAVRRVDGLGGAEVVIHPRGDDAYPLPRAVYTRCGFVTQGRTRVYTR